MIESISFNNKIVVEAYQKEALKAEVKSGFAHLSQKLNVKGLRVLMDAKLTDGTVIYKGATAYIMEELLQTQQFATKRLESPAVEGTFIIVDISHISFFSFNTPKTEE